MMSNKTDVRIKQMKTVISRIGLILCCAAATHVYLEERKGNGVMCHAIIEAYEHRIQDTKHKEEKKMNKDGDISDGRLFRSLKIDPADDNFVAFQNIVNTETMDGMLAELTLAFMKYFPVPYKVIMTLLYQYSVEKNKKQVEESMQQRQ
eukprot:8620984-Ditylum_brightwellii.AAC.1